MTREEDPTMYIFLFIVALWIFGSYVTEVFMKAGLRKAVDNWSNEDISIPIVIFWPIASLCFLVYWFFAGINYSTKYFAKLIRQKILKMD